MRSILSTVALLALAAALVPATASTAPPCVPTCTVPSTTFAYVPPVLVVADGATVTWTSADGQPHTSTSTAACMNAVSSAARAATVLFTVIDGTLWARDHTGREMPCLEAVTVAEDVRQLDYVCLLHNAMRGTLLVKS